MLGFLKREGGIEGENDKIYIDEKLFHKRVENIAIPKVNFVNDNSNTSL